MREQLEILASLQKLDREIKEKSGAKEALLAEIRKSETEIAAKRSEAALLRAAWAERDKLRQEKERLLQEEGKRATDKRMRMTRIKNIKELQALQREIDQIKQGNAQTEEELIRLFEELEGAAAALKEKEDELKKVEESWGARRQAIEAQVVEADQAVQETGVLRQSIAARLNGDLIQRYELIFSRRGGMAVVTVVGGICQGCFMNVPPQMWNEIIRGERLILCPSCHRILYHQPAAPSDKETQPDSDKS